MKMLKFRSNQIYSPHGLKIKQDRDIFTFKDINPSVEFVNVLGRFKRLQLSIWFLLSAFK